jgi:hypothetical protein
MHRMKKQKGWVIWRPHLFHKVFKIWPILTSNWKHLPHLARKQSNKGEGPSALNVMDYFFASTFGCYSELLRGQMCYKGITKLET